jgi:8-oxo-dGTP pyrophosphatase MutT (NUDIX family)
MNSTQQIIELYLANFGQKDEPNLGVLIEQLKTDKDLFDRKNFTGHIVANSLVINPKKEVLTIFHNKLQMYLQPGGHVEKEDSSIIAAACRELEEETGIKGAILDKWHTKNDDLPIFIESHLIPANPKKEEPQHYHHDFMYVFHTGFTDVNLQLEEVSDFVWTPIEQILTENPTSFLAKSLQRVSVF